ncbi:hypothetical protein CLU86_1607 [Acidovorax sp. 62]|uniref:hypothetical protein n=1 Tax=Acidovorax sp. 62 TaxID=2035203 RepID=UPI000C1A282A|nr:hypothetical protein [Acidovorax sp. 62]PIF90718.1 hypothetical protein CLU86_1607 [Acidovorax sp. 62]
MNRSLARRLGWWLIAWMALASLHSALAATLVLARVGGGAEMIEVCTTQGVRWVSMQATQGNVDAAPEPGSAGATTSDNVTGDAGAIGADGTPHCPLCRFIGDAAPDFTRSDLRFAPPLQYRQRPPDKPQPLSAAARVVLMSPPRGPPLAGS